MFAKKRAEDIKWIPKLWGGEKIICNNEFYCGKLLIFMKGRRASLHYHCNKREHFFLKTGKLEVWFSDELNRVEKFMNAHGTDGLYDILEKEILEQGDVFYVPPKRLHMIHALSDSELFEFSTHDELSDSYRLLKSE